MSVTKITEMNYYNQSLKENKASLIKCGSKSLFFSILNSYLSKATGSTLSIQLERFSSPEELSLRKEALFSIRKHFGHW
jgi:hypothetical protein